MTMTIRWFPAHAGPLGTGSNRNEEADRAAHALTGRGASSSPQLAEQELDEASPLTTYRDILEWYRANRRTFPPPHPRLTKREAVVYRQLQTNALMTPVIAKHMCPEVFPSDVCVLCKKDRATASHILWDCRLHPSEANTAKTLPPLLASATRDKDYEIQHTAVQQVLGALERQRPETAASTGGNA